MEKVGKGGRKGLRVFVTCISCGYKWMPSPRRWRNHLNYEMKYKVLTCPDCGIKNRISIDDVAKILKRNRR